MARSPRTSDQLRTLDSTISVSHVKQNPALSYSAAALPFFPDHEENIPPISSPFHTLHYKEGKHSLRYLQNTHTHAYMHTHMALGWPPETKKLSEAPNLCPVLAVLFQQGGLPPLFSATGCWFGLLLPGPANKLLTPVFTQSIQTGLSQFYSAAYMS